MRECVAELGSANLLHVVNVLPVLERNKVDGCASRVFGVEPLHETAVEPILACACKFGIGRIDVDKLLEKLGGKLGLLSDRFVFVNTGTALALLAAVGH